MYFSFQIFLVFFLNEFELMILNSSKDFGMIKCCNVWLSAFSIILGSL